MLAEELKPPKRARNPPHNWAEQKEKKKKKVGFEEFGHASTVTSLTSIHEDAGSIPGLHHCVKDLKFL